MSTLSVEISSNGSSRATASPMFFNQRVTVPSVTLSPSAGNTMGTVEPPAEGAAGGGVTGIAEAAGAGTSSVGAGTTIAAGAGAAAGAAGAGAPASSAAPMTASSAPTSTVASSSAVMDRSTPATGEGISVSTLSVEISNKGSSMATVSPMFLSQRVTVPSVTLSPSCGIVTETGIGLGTPSCWTFVKPRLEVQRRF
ncbi:unannotated protein [freshwater metagenome]|uniref:Unannotated protein n=1 Tax=freshwater metagenome TaxID=449393 RepID=A0A6J6C036_9ZZZZ